MRFIGGGGRRPTGRSLPRRALLGRRAQGVGTGAAGGEAITGLDVAGNTLWSPLGPTESPSPRFQWSGPTLLAPYPLTFILRALCRPQPNGGGYWTFFFHWQDSGNGVFDFTDYDGYGVHPYPEPPEGGTPYEEISMCSGDHLLDEDNGDNPTPTVFGEWRTRVFRASATGFLRSHFNWGGLGRLEVQNPARPSAPNPVLIMLDAPWRIGGEVPNAIIRGIQIYDAELSDAEVDLELATPGSVRTPWYLNLNPTPTDISDKSGNGHDPAWLSADRPGLWTGP